MKQTIILILVFVVGYWIGKLVISSEQPQPQEPEIVIKETIKTEWDTVWLEKKKDTIPTPFDTIKPKEYTYTQETDTNGYKITLFSREEPIWYSFKCWHNNTLHIQHDTIFSTNSVIEYVERPQDNRKQPFLTRFKFYPTIGLGYGIINKKCDIYAGVGITYEF